MGENQDNEAKWQSRLDPMWSPLTVDSSLQYTDFVSLATASIISFLCRLTVTGLDPDLLI